MGGARVIREEFRSFSTLLETVNTRPDNKIMSGLQHSIKNDKEFTGTNNYEEACGMLATGYLQILKKLEKGVTYQNKLNAKFFQSIEHPRPYTGIQGYIPCVPNAIRNIPQSMITVDRKPMKRKTLHILYANNGNSDKETQWFINAGTALLSAVDLIERGGIQTKIDLAFFVSQNDGEMTFPTICIKNYGERYSLQKISFPLAHPSMFRRIGFKWLETTPDITEGGFRYGYGCSPAHARMEENLEISDPATYFISADWINRKGCSVEEILKKFEVI